MIYRQTTEYLQKCYACGRAGHTMYRINTEDGQQYIVCSQAHASELEKRLKGGDPDATN